MFETENEWQKTEPVPIPLPRASRAFSKKNLGPVHLLTKMDKWDYLQSPIKKEKSKKKKNVLTLWGSSWKPWEVELEPAQFFAIHFHFQTLQESSINV